MFHSRKNEIESAAKLLKSGGVVVFPTETVYGLGADASNPEAIRRIFQIKGRPANHPLIVHLPSHFNLSDWAIDIPDVAYLLADKFWPGPLTLILHRAPSVQKEVAVMMPNMSMSIIWARNQSLRVVAHRLRI